MKKIITVIAIASVSIISCQEATDNYVKNELQEISNKVAKDHEDQYHLAVKGGDKMEIYTMASLVAESYKQAKDETNYLKWKEISNKHKAEVGL